MKKLTEASRVLVELPFKLFVRIADSDNKLSAAEMRQFEALICDPSWCSSELLARSLAILAEKRGDLWSAYAAEAIDVGEQQVASDISAVLSVLPSVERRKMRSDLCAIASAIADAAQRAAGPFSRDAEARDICEGLLTTLLTPHPTSGVIGRSSRERLAVEADYERLLDTEGAGPRFVSEKSMRLRCIEIITETHDVKTFRFATTPARLFAYKPGQFVTLEIEIDRVPVRRCYTISSSPSRPHSLDVTVKRVDGGLISNWLHDQMTVGREIGGLLPSGAFNCIDKPAERLLLLSAGSGITPAMSMARWLVDTADPRNVRFLHFARSPQDLIFRDEVRFLSTRTANFAAEYVCSKVPEGVDWCGRIGRISLDLLEASCPDFMSRSVFCCGPGPFMERAERLLKSVGFPMDRYFQESFGGGAAKPSKPKTLAAPVEEFKIEFSAVGQTASCRSNTSILDAAEAAGVELPSSCRAGQCGACKVRVSSGKVSAEASDALTPNEIEDGYVLACQARPASDLVVS